MEWNVMVMEWSGRVNGMEWSGMEWNDGVESSD